MENHPKLNHPKSGVVGISWHTKTQKWLIRKGTKWIGTKSDLDDAKQMMVDYLDGAKLNDHPNRKTKVEETTARLRKNEQQASRYHKKKITVKKKEVSEKVEKMPISSPFETVEIVEEVKVEIVEEVKVEIVEEVVKVEKLETATHQNYKHSDEFYKPKPYFEPLVKWKWEETIVPDEKLEPDINGIILVGAMPSRCQLCRRNQDCPNDYQADDCEYYEDEF